MIIVGNDKEIEVKETPLLEDLIVYKWGYDLSDKIEVKDINNVTSELNAWGIPYKWN